MIDKKSLFEKCQCSTHCFEIEYFCYEPKDDKGFYLSFWTYARKAEKLCWKERIRWIWNIIKTGNPWSDSIIINNEQAKEITEYINKHL